MVTEKDVTGRSAHQCCVCLEEIQDARCLPCLHVLCFSCLKMISMQNNRFQRYPSEKILHPPPLSCPICRHTVPVSATSIDAFPSPIICKICHEYVGRVVTMSCGHRNSDICCLCLTRDEKRRLVCPHCGRKTNVADAARMFRCHACHEFYSAKCGSCTPELCGPGIPSESFDFAMDAACPSVYANGSWLLASVIFALACVGIISLAYARLVSLDVDTRDGDAYSPDAEAYDAVCCSITVWHVDPRGNVDTSWCSGDDWKLYNSSCAVWPEI